MRTIKLTEGKEAIVDDDMYEYLNSFSWHANIIPTTGRTYAAKKSPGITMHRFIMNCPKGMVVDHINNNSLDNRKCNLRVCTRQQNNCNKPKQKRKTSSQYKGVEWSTTYKKWLSRIRKDGKIHHIGLFESEKEAALAYNKKAIDFHGEYAWLNAI